MAPVSLRLLQRAYAVAVRDRSRYDDTARCGRESPHRAVSRGIR